MEIRKILRQDPHPRNHKHTIDKARDLVNGVFYLEEELEEERMRGTANLGATVN